MANVADDVHVVFARSLEDGLARHHHAEIDDLKIVALQHNAHDVLANIVYIALDRRHQDLAVGRGAAVLFILDKGL